MANNVATQENRQVREQRDPRNTPQAWLQPQVNIVETKEAYVLEAEMPGVGKDGLEVLLEGNELTIVGHRKQDIGNVQLVYRESYDRDFRRTFELDPTIDAERISARMENGLLLLQLPKAEKVKPRKISVE